MSPSFLNEVRTSQNQMNNFEGTMGMSLSTKISSLKEKIGP